MIVELPTSSVLASFTRPLVFRARNQSMEAPKCLSACGHQQVLQGGFRRQRRMPFTAAHRHEGCLRGSRSRQQRQPKLRLRAQDEQKEDAPADAAAHDAKSGGGGGTDGLPADGRLNEDLLQELMKKEKDLETLRKKLQEAKEIQGQRGSDAQRRLGPRIDGADLKRENILFGTGNKGRDNWVGERSMEFFRLGAEGSLEGGPGDGPSEEEKATVTRRLAVGLALAAVAGVLALVPLDVFTSAPSKPLFFYLTPLIRVQALLDEAEPIVQNAEWDDLRFVLQRISGPPNSLKENLQSAAAALPDTSTRDQAKELARDCLEYVNSIDYDKYFDAQGRRGSKGGRQEAQFVEFSASSVAATRSKLASFLALFPRDEVEAAREQAAPRFD